LLKKIKEIYEGKGLGRHRTREKPMRLGPLREAVPGIRAPDLDAASLETATTKPCAGLYFASLERELLDLRSFRTRREAEAPVSLQIEGWNTAPELLSLGPRVPN
jgi:hypothetical protein